MDRGMVIFQRAAHVLVELARLDSVPVSGNYATRKPYQKSETDDPYPQPLQGEGTRGQEGVPGERLHVLSFATGASERFSNWWDENGQEHTGADIKRSWGCGGPFHATTSMTTRPCSARCARAGSRQHRRAEPVGSVAPHAHAQPAVRESVEHHAVVPVLYTRRRSSGTAATRRCRSAASGR